MHIVCPHCSTSYAVNLATLGAAGRTVRCSRCKEVWLARQEDAVDAPTAAMAEADRGTAGQDAAGWDAPGRGEEGDTPHVDSPSITGDWPSSAQGSAPGSAADWSSAANGCATNRPQLSITQFPQKR